MRLPRLCRFLLPILLTGCAFKGVIVEKQAGPQPFYHSLGTDGSYAFLLRDESGAVHRQLVTPWVFARYAVGDYFDDLLPGPTQNRPEGKAMVSAVTPTAKEAPRAAQVKKTAKSRHLSATRKHKAGKTVRRQTKHRAAGRKVARRKSAPPRAQQTKRVALPPRLAQSNDGPILFVSVVRCR